MMNICVLSRWHIFAPTTLFNRTPCCLIKPELRHISCILRLLERMSLEMFAFSFTNFSWNHKVSIFSRLSTVSIGIESFQWTHFIVVILGIVLPPTLTFLLWFASEFAWQTVSDSSYRPTNDLFDQCSQRFLIMFSNHNEWIKINSHLWLFVDTLNG